MTMQEVTGDVFEWTLEKWVAQFHSIYGQNNKNKSGLLIWANVVDDASTLAESVRREKYSRIPCDIAHIFAWYCSFIAKYTIAKPTPPPSAIGTLMIASDDKDAHITNWIVTKYPQVCPVCGENPCHCPSFRGEAEGRKEIDKVGFQLSNPKEWEVYSHWHMLGKYRTRKAIEKMFDEHNKLKEDVFPSPFPCLEELVRMFLDVYSGANHDQPVENVCFHLLEEIGEVMHIVVSLENLANDHVTPPTKSNPDKVSKADLSNFLHKELRKELADVFSWLVALVNKLNYMHNANSPTIGTNKPKARGVANRAYFTLTKMVYDCYVAEHTIHFECPLCHSPSCRAACAQEKLTKDFLGESVRLQGIFNIVGEWEKQTDHLGIKRWTYVGANKKTGEVRNPLLKKKTR